MLDRHEQFARDAAAQGAQVVCFQELFYGPYFGITQDKKYYRYAEPADGPVVQRFASLARILFSADLWFAICFLKIRSAKVKGFV